MTNYDYEELRLSKWQIGLTLLFILLLMVSLTLTYNQILKFTKQKPLYSDKEADNILKIYETRNNSAHKDSSINFKDAKNCQSIILSAKKILEILSKLEKKK